MEKEKELRASVMVEDRVDLATVFNLAKVEAVRRLCRQIEEQAAELVDFRKREICDDLAEVIAVLRVVKERRLRDDI